MTKSFLRTAAPLTVAFALVTGVAAAAGTPLGTWMKSNMGTSLAGQDFPTLQKNFDFLATKQPAGYADWSKFAKAGSAAASKQDLVAVKAACKGCHDAYKEKYRKDFPATPFP